jgi:hypothetical protein
MLHVPMVKNSCVYLAFYITKIKTKMGTCTLGIIYQHFPIVRIFASSHNGETKRFIMMNYLDWT